MQILQSEKKCVYETGFLVMRKENEKGVRQKGAKGNVLK
jgi:hypothetical protein